MSICDKLINAHQNNSLPEIVYELAKSRKDNDSQTIVNQLVTLHNEGKINVLQGSKQLRNVDYTFFFIRDIFSKAIPQLNAHTKEVMECILNLFIEAGKDLAADWVFTSFNEFFLVNSSRPKEVLAIVDENPEKWANFVYYAITTGSNFDIEYFFAEAMRLLINKNNKIRAVAAFSLGKIKYPEDSKFPKQVLSSFNSIVIKEKDDFFLGHIVISICELCMVDESLTNECLDILEMAISNGQEHTLHGASNVFSLNAGRLPALLLDKLLLYLLTVNIKNKGTLDMVGLGMVKLMEAGDHARVIEFIESFLLRQPENFSLESLGCFYSALRRNVKLINTLLTRWFLKGEPALYLEAQTLVEKWHGDQQELEIDSNELPCADLAHIIFIAHKTIGYLFVKPIAAASIIVSLMRQTTDDAIIQHLSDLLFNALLINFSGNLVVYLTNKLTDESKYIRTAIQKALKANKVYLATLKSAGVISELHPSEHQREIYLRHYSQIFSAHYKAAISESSFINSCKKSVILYGSKSINYTKGDSKQPQRMEIPMHMHSTHIKMPRQEHIDPFDLDYMIRIYRTERMLES